ncbi:hypothetical protein MSAN_02382300 [Mycena sanguinolenta]|uniref:Uncharacterized protein n=1 Tax=Mycena sanguinolenta TaxID=230812 RepID=A0A8H7CEF3_9AGAR|nr:hypothetical protein MSAN_02382300 [Mycena sanguinolenta]
MFWKFSAPTLNPITADSTLCCSLSLPLASHKGKDGFFSASGRITRAWLTISKYLVEAIAPVNSESAGILCIRQI